MFVQIPPTSTIRNIWRILKRICILILELKGLKHWIDQGQGSRTIGKKGAAIQKNMSSVT